jgi:predicted small metal-binding protein
MSKIVDCNKVNPTSGCHHVVRGDTEEELLKNAAEHAKEHGMEPTPELLAMVKGYMEDER